MSQKFKVILILMIGFLVGYFVKDFFDHYKIQKRSSEPPVTTSPIPSSAEAMRPNNSSEIPPHSSDIDVLTKESLVIDFVKKNGRLPECYITKNEAKNRGWIASKGNLCEVLPGRAIGGDHFSNRERQLPKGVQYYEADVNYNCGRRNADRIIFTKNGDVWLTKNHYKSFEKQ